MSWEQVGLLPFQGEVGWENQCPQIQRKSMAIAQTNQHILYMYMCTLIIYTSACTNAFIYDLLQYTNYKTYTPLHYLHITQARF